jgi:serine/threonine protein kinase
MDLQPGQMLLHYRLAEKIGEGGMGVVWRALDTTLDRDVAIKILPEAFSADSDRVSRFEREAKVLASLNHPNIASIHGLHETEHLRFLAMELVRGESLAQRLERGPVALEETLGLAVPIAEALEAAHENGIIHRDLKPANIQVTPDGKVKVLDFGLAKALDMKSSSGDPANSPTVTSDGTMAGAILGTAAYMSPEQARGKPVDKRTDIWAFGCVLYECLAGRPAYHGETITDVLSAILRAEPEWAALPHNTPVRVRDLLDRCLQKAVRDRIRDIGDVRIDIERSLAGRDWENTASEDGTTGAVARRLRWRGAAVLVAGIIVGAAAATVGTFISGRSDNRETTRLSLQVPPTQTLSDSFFAVTPDGRTIAYSALEKNAADGDWIRKLYLRSLDSYETIAVEGSEGMAGAPAFSPDGKEIAWVASLPTNPARHLIVAPVTLESPPRVIGKWPPHAHRNPSVAWLADGNIVALTRSAESGYAVTRFVSDGSSPATATPLRGLDIADFDTLGGSSVLPDGKTLLAEAYLVEGNISTVAAVTIDTQSGETHIAVEDARWPAWSATGHILFGRRNVLMAAPFGPEGVEATGGPSTIIEGTEIFALSASGTLVYRSGKAGETARRVASLGAERAAEYWSEDRRAFRNLSVSPDGRRVALRLGDPEDWDWQIWTSETDRPRLRPLVEDDCWSPVWAPDSEQLIYWCGHREEGRTQGLYVSNLATGGEPALLLESKIGVDLLPTSVSPDGAHLLLNRFANEGISSVIAPFLSEKADDSSLRVIVPAQIDEPNARFSPDGAWIAHISSRTGRPEAVLRSVDSKGHLGPETVVSIRGATDVIWAKNEGARQELLYSTLAGQLMAITVEGDSGPVSSGPRPILDLHDQGVYIERNLLALDTLPGGGYLAILRGDDERSNRLNVVLGFDEVIQRRTSTPR